MSNEEKKQSTLQDTISDSDTPPQQTPKSKKTDATLSLIYSTQENTNDYFHLDAFRFQSTHSN